MSTSERTEAPSKAAAASSPRSNLLTRWMRPEARSRRLLLAGLVYIVCTSAYATLAGPDRLVQHTSFNHYALLADAWLHGRQDLGGHPPFYTQNNDFAEYQGKTYISFPPLPAMLMLPFVKLAGSAENFRDGQFVIWLAGLAPAFLFCALEKLRRTGRSLRSERENLILGFLFAFGTVYFFTAVEGTVWFAAMVIGAALSALYTLWALDAERPALAGAMMACAYLTRPPILLASALFALEALRVSRRPRSELAAAALRPSGAFGRARERMRLVDAGALTERYALFAAPIALAFGVMAWMNFTRYGRASPFPSHVFLTVAWQARMLKWGMLSYHYMAKNLGVALTSLPWLPPPQGDALFGAPFKVNEHGLALWFTTPLYAWLLWPRRFDGDPDRKWLYSVTAASAALPALMDLLYQNTGWRQFGYRFSNDYAVLLFVLLAVGARPMRRTFALAAAWGLVWNAFGAATFDKAQYDRFYFRDGTQTIVYQPD
jgi:hypothetical protein